MSNSAPSDRLNKKKLRKEIENFVRDIQETTDTEAAKSISEFSSKVQLNRNFYKELGENFHLKADSELEQFEVLEREHLNQLAELEKKIEYYEKLYDEIEELESELEVKDKLNKNRQSRLMERNARN